VPNAPRHATDDILAVSWWCPVDVASRTGLARCTMTINGLSWPHTKRYEYTQGDSVFWRVVNFTDLDHPMHLHGFYFRMDAKGNGVADTIYTAAQRRMAVTEVIPPFQTMAFAWRAERAGNWIYHCHYATHLSSLVALDTENGHLEHSALDNHASDRPHQMFGLVVGMTVAPRGPQARATGPERAIRILQREKPNVYGTQPGMSFVMDGTPDATNADALPVPGPTLVLERGKPVAVTTTPPCTGTASSSRATRTACQGGADRARTSCHRSRLATRSRCAGRRRARGRSCTTRISPKRSRWAVDCMARSS
jgi:hypothetical protein